MASDAKREKRRAYASGKRNVRREMTEALPFLRAMQTVNPKYRPLIIDRLDDRGRDILCRGVSNVVENPALNEKTRKRLAKKLSPHRDAIRSLCKKCGSKNKRKKILTQLGGFPLSLVLSTALPLLLNLINRK